MKLHEAQADFARALLDPDAAIPGDLRGRDGAPSQKRFSVYRNNVTASLTEALIATFPALVKIVGETFFRAAASVYVRLDPPKSPVLISYGAGFAVFLESFEPAAGLPYLADVARLEMAWVDAYHAADRPVLQADDLAAVAPQQLGAIRFEVHPSARIIASKFPIVTIWTMNRSGEPRPVDMSIAEAALVTRPALDVEVRKLPADGVTFLQALAGGERFEDAAELAASGDAEFDIAGTIAGFLEAGLFSRILSADGGAAPREI